MSYDTAVQHNVYWFGDRKITTGDSQGPLEQQIAEIITHRFDEAMEVVADNGAEEFDVVVSVKLIPKERAS